MFQPFFKQWEYVFYMDTGMKIHSDMNILLDAFPRKGKLCAMSDTFPSYHWKLGGQFEHGLPPFQTLKERFDLEVDYFQTCVVFFDTDLITDTLYQDIVNVNIEYPISRTNEQGIMNIYFVLMHPLWEQIAIGDEKQGYYIYKNVWNKPYIITKC
jgi:hypothetical protein